MKLEADFREKIASQQKADATADAYWGWVERFIRYVCWQAKQ